MNKQGVVREILKGCHPNPKEVGKAFAPSNIALCKYWGKRDALLNLPLTSSLSISLKDAGTTTKVQSSSVNEDKIIFAGERLPNDCPFAKKTIEFINLFRPSKDFCFKITTKNNIPTAAGLASSASAFASLVLALNDFFQYNLSRQELSILARLGSGSASRSLWHGFVEWHAGSRPDGMDSFGTPLPTVWQSLCIGLLIFDTKPKSISSRDAMQRTKETSQLYKKWEEEVAKDLWQIKEAIRTLDFHLLGKTAQDNALKMHATMQDASPPIDYCSHETYAAREQIKKYQEEGLPIYFTQDAGPNLKILFEEKDISPIIEKFGNIKIIKPFSVLYGTTS